MSARHRHSISRRRLLALSAAACFLPVAASRAEGRQLVVHHDPACGCCTAWGRHMAQGGFEVELQPVAAGGLGEIKGRLGVPAHLASCHTAEIGGYLVEGHVPADAVLALLDEQPAALGLAVPGMPAGSPGMEGGSPQDYDVILFGPDVPNGERVYRRYVGAVPA